MAELGERICKLGTETFDYQGRLVLQPGFRGDLRFIAPTTDWKLDQATMRGTAGSLTLGDEVRVQTSVFDGWCRVHGITRPTRGGNVTLNFTEGAA